jgi:hypothetical protein
MAPCRRNVFRRNHMARFLEDRFAGIDDQHILAKWSVVRGDFLGKAV